MRSIAALNHLDDKDDHGDRNSVYEFGDCTMEIGVYYMMKMKSVYGREEDNTKVNLR